MIRVVYARQKVLELYRRIDKISYPIQPEAYIKVLPKQCRMMSYQRMASVTGCSIHDIAVMCNSSSGATHYDIEQDRYLILYNESMPKGRVLWTQCHEIGHISLDHLSILETKNIAFSDLGDTSQYESEADCFAWNFAAPLPVMRELDIQSARDIQTVFGLSSQAAALQADRYAKWNAHHTKTAWENDLLREFRRKYTG